MKKQIDIRKSVYEICANNPDIIEIMEDIGFKDIANPKILNTVGRFMTIVKGAAMKKISMDKIRKEFEKKGYKIIEDP